VPHNISNRTIEISIYVKAEFVIYYLHRRMKEYNKIGLLSFAKTEIQVAIIYIQTLWKDRFREILNDTDRPIIS
jgi:hypothetical protein